MPLLLMLLALDPDVPIAVEAPKKDPVVCTRRAAATLGSNIAQPRICKKKSEWDAEAKNAQRNLQKFRDHRSDPAKIPGGQPIPQ